MTSNKQSISSGPTAADKLALSLGYKNTMMVPGPSSCFAILQGQSGVGKTSLLSSNPDALILNLDLSSTPGKVAPKATLWPGLNSEGHPVRPHESGDPEQAQEFVLNFAEVQTMVNLLCKLAQDKVEGRPRVVVIDTIDVLQSMVMQHCVENQQQLRLSSLGDKPDFYSLGQAGWGKLADIIVSMVDRLRNHGYGVWLIMQTTMKWKKAGEVDQLAEDRLVTPSLFARLRPKAEMIFTVTKTKQSKVVEKNGRKMRDGEEVVHALHTDIVTLGSEGKSRRDLPAQITLPEANAWQMFETLYKESLKND